MKEAMMMPDFKLAVVRFLVIDAILGIPGLKLD
jgi:hypothetical protein